MRRLPTQPTTSSRTTRARTRARTLALVCAVLALGGLPAATLAASGWYHDRTYGVTPQPLGDHNHPDTLAADANGNVYVADNYNHRAQKFDASRTGVLAFGTAMTGQGGVRNPTGVGVSPVDGSVYVTDNGNRKIEKFNAAGQSVLSFGSSGSGNGQFNNPSAITVKSDGEVWVSDTGNHRIQRFSSAGVYLGQFGSNGGANGQFSSPRGACFASDGTFYVADPGNNRVQRFSAAGAFLNAYGSFGSGNGQFSSPTQVACDPGGTQFAVADDGNSRVQRFNSSFTYTGQFGSAGTGNGQFQGVTGVAIDSTGRIWASDFNGSRLQVFSSAGAFVGQAGSSNLSPDHYKNVFGIASNAAGTRVYVSDTNNHRIQYYDGSGNWLGSFGSPGTGNGQFNLPYGIAVMAGGDVLVLDRFNQRVQRFTANGAYVSQFGTAGSGNGQFSNPWDIAISPVDGSIFVTDIGNNRIQKFTSAGVYVAQVGTAGSGNGQFSSVNGIGVDSAGNVFVADSGNSRVQKFTAALAYTAQWGTAGTGDGQFTNPSGIAVMPDDTVVVVENSNPRIQHFSNAGVFLRKAGSSGIGTGQLGWPRNAKAAPDGSLYIADASNSRAVRWRLSTSGPPNTLFVHDTSAQAASCGGLFCVNPTDISAAQPHYSWINQYGATVTGQRTQVHTTDLDGVVGLWHFDGNGTDSSGNGATMVPTAPTYVTGARDFGSAFAPPAGGWGQVPAHARYSLSAYTVETWFQVSGPVTGYPMLVEQGSSGTNRTYAIYVDQGSQDLAVTYSSGGVARYPLGVAGAQFFDGLWHHVALTNDGSTLRLYVDGIERGSANVAALPADLPLAGPELTSGTSNLRVDDLRISSVVRTAQEIAGYYRARLPHHTLLWDSSPGDTPVANGSCTAGSRCADVVHGTGGSSPLGALRGGQFTVQQKQHDGTSWSDWSVGDWFEQTIGRPALAYVGDTSAATGSGNNANVLALNPRMSWTNNKGRTNGTVNRQRVQVVTTPLDDVQALYHFDTATGELADSTGNGNTLTAVAAPTVAAGQTNFAQARTLNGTSQYYTAAGSVADGSTVSVDAWFRTSGCSGAGSSQAIAAKSDGGSNGAFQIRIDCPGGTVHVKTTSGNGAGLAYAYEFNATNSMDGQWHHVAALVDGSTNSVQLVLDGVAQERLTLPGPIDTRPGEPLRIGYSLPNRYFNGEIDEVRVSTALRTPAEIKGYYETRRPHYTTMWDSDPTPTGTVAIASCADLARCADIPYSGGTTLRYGDARYYSRARYKASAQSYWTAWSDWDWFQAATPPAPTALRTHDTNANPGSTNPANIGVTAPHFSFVASLVQDAVAQRTQVVTSTLDSVVGLWHLDGGYTDASTVRNHYGSVFAGAPTWVAGSTDFGQALRFDGDDLVELSSKPAYDLDEFTVETWFSTTTLGPAGFPNMVGREAVNTNRNFLIHWAKAPNRLCADSSVAGVQRTICANAPAAWTDGSWHHVAYTRTAAGVMTLWVDGVAQATGTFAGNVDNPANAIRLGDGFAGDLDEVRISSVAKTGPELLGYVRTRRPHNATMWDSSPSDAGAALPACSSGSRCADVVYGTGGGQLPLIRDGARYFVRAKVFNQAGSWSAWGSDWFETATTLTVGVDSATRNLGTLLPGADATGTTVVTVTTNNATGYQLSAVDQHDSWAVQKDASNNVPDWTGTGATPTTWAAGTPGYFGLSVLGATGGAPTRLAKWGTGTNTAATDFTNNLWAGLDFSTATLLHQRTGEHVAPDTVTVAYRANVAALQAGGTYSGTITYTAVANP